MRRSVVITKATTPAAVDNGSVGLTGVAGALSAGSVSVSGAAWNLPATISVQQDGTVGLRQYALNAGAHTISVSGLPTGVTYNAGTESLEGAATGTSSGTATFTLTRVGGSDVVDTATVALYEPGNWQLAVGHYVSYFPLHVIYPRPDAETNTWARHRHAYPGILYEIPIGVQFGAWPYKYEKVAGPAWLNIVAETMVWVGDHMEIPEGYGVLAGTAPATPQAAQSVTVRVTDQAGAFVDVVFSVTVSADNFVFLDPVNGNDATANGTISAPFKEVSALQDADLGTGKICYIRQTTESGYIPTPARQFRMSVDNEPRAYLNYPNEVVTINCTLQSGFSNGANSDIFIAGLTIKDVNQTNKDREDVRAIARIGGGSVRETVWKTRCINLYGGNSQRDNCGYYIQFDEGNARDTGARYLYFVDNYGQDVAPIPSGGNGPAFCQYFSTTHGLQERNVAVNWRSINTGILGVKHETYDIEVRANDTSQCTSQGGREYAAHGGSESGDLYPSENQLFWYNRAYNDLSIFPGAVPDVLVQNNIIFARNSSMTLTNQDIASWSDRITSCHDNVTINNPSLPLVAGNDSGNVVVGASGLDSNRNLIGSARSLYLGTKGAEVA